MDNPTTTNDDVAYDKNKWVAEDVLPVILSKDVPDVAYGFLIIGYISL